MIVPIKERVGVKALEYMIMNFDGDDIVEYDEMTSGVTAPCGPCSELYYDFHPERGTSNVVSMTCLTCTFALLFSFHVQDLRDDTRFIEFYNLVFMQYNKKHDGSLELLKQKNIDTGHGLERAARISQKVRHTSSHLLQSALKRVIGRETSQVGSMVAFDRLRFDFNFHRPILDKELVEIEDETRRHNNSKIIIAIGQSMETIVINRRNRLTYGDGLDNRSINRCHRPIATPTYGTLAEPLR
ncbi:putative alanine--tRNA ligase, chloroplastic [Capsicum chinense]|nr:putative alanine--tRNA ligase, chloroplastic [Capsicum chinense]